MARPKSVQKMDKIIQVRLYDEEYQALIVILGEKMVQKKCGISLAELLRQECILPMIERDKNHD